MINVRHIKVFSLALFLMSGFLGLTSLFFFVTRPTEIFVSARDKKCVLKSLPFSFGLSSSAYEKIGAPFMRLAWSPPLLELPDLRHDLIFYGMNARPDATVDSPLLHFGLPGTKKPVAIAAQEKLYLSYHLTAAGSGSGFSFSENNRPTPIWILAESEENEAVVSVQMQDPSGNFVEDEAHGHFKMAAREWVKQGAQQGKEVWEIGKTRVDGTLLARQQARWFGMDLFLQKHGGEDYIHTLNKHRIDFGESPSIYSVFVEQGDCLVWETGGWKEVEPGPNSLGKPLLYVKKVDDRIMSLDLWDELGHRKIPLTLIRSNEIWAKESLGREFRFLGSRTKTQCVFEIGENKILLKPDDWMILTQEGWRKLETEEEIDQYVERKLSGTLFVFDGIVKKDEHQVLVGTLFNPSRTDSETMELAIQQSQVTIIPSHDIQIRPSIEHACSKKRQF